MSDTTITFVDETAEKVPSLKAMRDEHEDFYDETLPHVFFGEVSAWVVDQVASSSPSQDVTRLIGWLDESYRAGDPDVQNVIDASFIENVEDDAAVVRMLTPLLLSRVQQQYRPR